FLLRLHVERTHLLVAGELPHHELHAADHLGPAFSPVLDRLHGDGFAVLAAVDEEVVAWQPALAVVGRHDPTWKAPVPDEESEEREARHGDSHWWSLLNFHASGGRAGQCRKGVPRRRQRRLDRKRNPEFDLI